MAKNHKTQQKCQISIIFVIAEICKIDLEALFFRILKIPMAKINRSSASRNSCCSKKFFPGMTDFTEANF